MNGARLHLIGGGHVDVAQLPEDAARLLWGRKSGDDAYDMGYAPLQQDGQPKPKAILVNPRAVAYVEPLEDEEPRFRALPLSAIFSVLLFLGR